MAEMTARGQGRRNARLGLMVLAVLLVVALIPAVCRRYQRPEASYATRAEAVRAGALERGWIPAFLPPSATRIHERHDVVGNRRFVRFAFAPADLAPMTAGMRRLSQAEVERLVVPPSGWATWWPISSRTLSGSQGKVLQVHEVATPADRGYLAVDPRTHTGFYWSR